MVEKVCSEFDKVVVVINANNAMELGWVDEYPQIGAVILAPGAGNTGLTALGEIMAGTVNPSGKTADTYVKDLTTTPTWNNFGNFSYSNVDDLKQAIAANDGAYEGNLASSTMWKASMSATSSMRPPLRKASSIMTGGAVSLRLRPELHDLHRGNAEFCF